MRRPPAGAGGNGPAALGTLPSANGSQEDGSRRTGILAEDVRQLRPAHTRSAADAYDLSPAATAFSEHAMKHGQLCFTLDQHGRMLSSGTAEPYGEVVWSGLVSATPTDFHLSPWP